MSSLLNVSNASINRAKERELKEHSESLRRLQQEHAKEYQDIAYAGEEAILDLRKSYDLKLAHEKMKLEQELESLRAKYNQRINEENNNFEIQLADLRKANRDRLIELRDSNEKNVRRINKEHQEYVDATQLRSKKIQAKS